jgi:hypothetical protein
MIDLIQHEAGTTTSRIVSVDPPTARRWLEANKRNRPILATAVERYRRDMAAGQWIFTADPLRFSASGMLLDGQHRLTALSMLDDSITITMLVIRGLPEDTQLFMDQGVKRTPGAQLALLGVKNANHVASAARLFIVWQSGLMFRDTSVAGLITSAQIQAWVADNADLVELEHELHGKLSLVDGAPSVSTAAAFSFARVDRDEAINFISLLASGADLYEGHPILTLDKRLRRIRKEGIKVSNRDLLAFFVQAWNAWRDGRQMSKFQRPRGGSWSPANFPSPH